MENLLLDGQVFIGKPNNNSNYSPSNTIRTLASSGEYLFQGYA